jgi:glycosyltransferase involved in cell wall biosynthesis
MRWHILTGEYPPQPGGVSDYTRQVAAGLAREGDEVHVWAAAHAGPGPGDGGVVVHRLPDHFGPRGLVSLDRGLCRFGPHDRLLVQYVPHMYGCKAMNLAFCTWLRLRARRPWVMFHEVAFPVRRGQALRHNVLGRVTHAMATLVAGSAVRVFVSIPRWHEVLRRCCRLRRPAHWLPVPSNVPTRADVGAVGRARADLLAGGGEVLLGHFGTFGDVAPLLRALLPPLLRRDAGRRAALIGRGSTAFAANLVAHEPDLAGRVRARADLPAEDVAAHLAACDVLVQPYADGVSSRRGSVMAGLALGRPVVTTNGAATEPIWAAEGLVEAAPVGHVTALLEKVEGLLASPDLRARLAGRGRAGYDARFSCERTIEVLRGVTT